MSSMPNDSLFALVESKDWPTPQHTIEFMDAAELLWGTEAGRAQVKAWAEVLGQQSHFIEEELWSPEQLRKHFEALDRWNKVNAPVNIRRPGRPRSEDFALNCQIAERRKAWHDAIAMRKEKLAISKEQMDSIIATARATHKALIEEWDAYCDHMKRRINAPDESNN